MRKKNKRHYEIVNIHPQYESQEAKDKAMEKLCNKLFQVFKNKGLEDLMIVKEDTN